MASCMASCMASFYGTCRNKASSKSNADYIYRAKVCFVQLLNPLLFEDIMGKYSLINYYAQMKLGKSE